MYVVAIGPRSETRTTLAGVLHLLNDDREGRATPRVEDISVRHVERGSIPVVSLGHGKFGVRPVGSIRAVLSQVIEEIDRFIVRVDGKVLRPHELTRTSWGSVATAGRLGYFPEEVASVTDRTGTGALSETADLFESQFDAAAFVETEFVRRFGYGTNGPPYHPNRGVNARHEVHVAYALLRGDPVRTCVINAYRDRTSLTRSDLQWMDVLIRVPEWRGVLTESQLQGLCLAMRSENIPITPNNAPRLLSTLRQAPVDANDALIDDVLFEAGILPPVTTPPLRLPVGDDAAPVSALAERIHQFTTERLFKDAMARAKSDREAMRISQRRFDDLSRRAVNARLSTGYGWANKVALAVLQRDVATLLKVFDGPRDWNTDSKRAVREVLGVDLLGCSSTLRRQRLFAMCGFSSEEQEQWEKQAAADKAQRLAARDFEEACKLAESSRWRMDNGQLLNGREYVDLCIAEGYSRIVDRPRGRAREYFIHDIRRGHYRRLRAKDGTLSYARARLAQSVALVPLAA